jgi:hypothetical protein
MSRTISVQQDEKPDFVLPKRIGPAELLDAWGYQDLNLGPLRYQRSALTA